MMNLYTEIKPNETELTFDKSYRYWHKNLFNRLMRLFTWNGLPFPQRELEFNLMARGSVGIFDVNGLFASQCGLTGVTEYPDKFIYAVYANPIKGSGMKKIDKDCVVIYNDDLMTSLIPFVERYANLLAHSDLSFQIALINSRSMGALVAPNAVVAESIKEWYSGLKKGKMFAIMDDESMQTLANAKGVRSITDSFPSTATILDYYTAQQNILKSFYNDLGVKYSTEKKERLITDEVNSENDMLLVNIDAMLENRKKACEDMKKIFNIDVSVELTIKKENCNYDNNRITDDITNGTE